MHFIDESIEQFYLSVIKPSSIGWYAKLRLRASLAAIDLSHYPPAKEVFIHPHTYKGVSGEHGSINLVWNIDSIISYIHTTNQNPLTISPNELIDLGVVNMNDPRNQIILANAEKIYETGCSAQHRFNAIITARLPFFSDFRIIDGNHKFFESYLSGQQIQYYCFDGVDDPRVIHFLMPSSREFLYVLDRFSVMLKYPRLLPPRRDVE